MRPIALCLLLVLAACAAPRAEVSEQRASAGTATEPGAAPPGSAAILALWNAGERRRELRLVDPASGAEMPGQPPVVGDYPFAFSADGRKLAAHEPSGQACEPAGGGTACRPGAGVLRLVDLPAWREAAAVALPAKGWVGLVAFSPDAARVALVANDQQVSTLIAVDAASGAVVGERALERGFRPSLLAYRRDGAALALYGQPLGDDPGMTKPGPPRALLVDAATLEVRWEQPLPELLAGNWCLESCPSHEGLFASWAPAVVATHDGRALYVVHADADRLTTVDLDARTVRTVEVRAERSWLERLFGLVAGVAEAKGGSEGARKVAVLSADGTRLYVTGSTIRSEPDPREVWRITQAALGVQVVEVPSGRRVGAAPVEGSGVALIAATPGGAHLLLRGWEPGNVWTEVLDARSLGRVARLVGWDVVVARRLDGQPIVLARQLPGRPASQLAVLDPESFEIVRSWSVGADASWLGTP